MQNQLVALPLLTRCNDNFFAPKLANFQQNHLVALRHQVAAAKDNFAPKMGKQFKIKQLFCFHVFNMRYKFLEPIWLFLYSWGMLGVWMIPMQVFRCCILFFSFLNFGVYLLWEY
jgi:hypothetical protein